MSVTTLVIDGDDVTATATELNIMDGNTAASGTVLVDADRVVVNDDGTMKQVALTDLSTYIGGVSNATTVTITANNTDNETVYPTFIDTATGEQGLETDTGLTYNPSSGILTATNFAGTVTGNVTGNASGTAATVTGAAQTAITSLGTLTALQVDNINVNGNTISSTAGIDLNITPKAGQQIVLDNTIIIDAGVVTGATSITSTAFVGDLTGNVTGNASGTALTVTQAAQSAITSLGTLTGVTVNGDINLNGGNDFNIYSDAGSTKKFYVDASDGSTSIQGALIVNNDINLHGGNDFNIYSDAGSTKKFYVDASDGATTSQGPLTVNSDINLHGGNDFNIYSDAGSTKKFYVDASDGNTTIAGTLGVTGVTTLTGALNTNGGIACDTNKFTVADTTGNVATAGTLGVTGLSTLTNVSINGATSISGQITANTQLNNFGFGALHALTAAPNNIDTESDSGATTVPSLVANKINLISYGNTNNFEDDPDVTSFVRLPLTGSIGDMIYAIAHPEANPINFVYILSGTATVYLNGTANNTGTDIASEGDYEGQQEAGTALLFQGHSEYGSGGCLCTLILYKIAESGGRNNYYWASTSAAGGAQG